MFDAKPAGATIAGSSDHSDAPLLRQTTFPLDKSAHRALFLLGMVSQALSQAPVEVAEGVMARLGLMEGAGYIRGMGQALRWHELALYDSKSIAGFQTLFPEEDPLHLPSNRLLDEALTVSRHWIKSSSPGRWLEEDREHRVRNGNLPFDSYLTALPASMPVTQKTLMEAVSQFSESSRAFAAGWLPVPAFGHLSQNGLRMARSHSDAQRREALYGAHIKGMHSALALVEAGKSLPYRIPKATARSHKERLLFFALRQPVFTSQAAASGMGISMRSAARIIDELAATNILIEVTGRTAWRAYTIAGLADL